MRALALDISTHAGFAVLEKSDGGPVGLLARGNVIVDLSVSDLLKTTGYPGAYLEMTWGMAKKFTDLVVAHVPDVVVIEEINLGRSRYTQRQLDWLHCAFCRQHQSTQYPTKTPPIVYVSSSAWRNNLGLVLTKADRSNNTRLSKAKRNAKQLGGSVDKSALGIKGKITAKHLSVRHANSVFGLDLIQKDNDIADAVCLGLAFFGGAKQCDGRNDRG
jgi:hypothetical protein